MTASGGWHISVMLPASNSWVVGGCKCAGFCLPKTCSILLSPKARHRHIVTSDPSIKDLACVSALHYGEWTGTQAIKDPATLTLCLVKKLCELKSTINTFCVFIRTTQNSWNWHHLCNFISFYSTTASCYILWTFCDVCVSS